MFGILATRFNKISINLIRLLLGLTLSSLGVVYTESFNTIPFFKYLAIKFFFRNWIFPSMKEYSIYFILSNI